MRYQFMQKVKPNIRNSSSLESSTRTPKRDASDIALFLNPECKKQGIRHYISSCGISDDSKTAALLEEYRRTKRALMKAARNGMNQLARFAQTPSQPHFSMFRASFAKGMVETNVILDQRAVSNFISAANGER